MTRNENLEFVRSRIIELRIVKGVSEHKMSLDLEKSGSYIRNITNGMSLPSIKELMNIIAYFNMTPVEFFAPLVAEDTSLAKLNKRLHAWSDKDIAKVIAFVDMIEK